MVEEVLNEYRMQEWKKKSKEIKANGLMTTFIVCWSLSLSLCLSGKVNCQGLASIFRHTFGFLFFLSLSLTHSVLSTNLQITSNSRSMPLTAGCFLIISDSYSMWHESEHFTRKIKYEQRLLHFKHEV